MVGLCKRRPGVTVHPENAIVCVDLMRECDSPTIEGGSSSRGTSSSTPGRSVTTPIDNDTVGRVLANNSAKESSKPQKLNALLSMMLDSIVNINVNNFDDIEV